MAVFVLFCWVFFGRQFYFPGREGEPFSIITWDEVLLNGDNPNVNLFKSYLQYVLECWSVYTYQHVLLEIRNVTSCMVLYKDSDLSQFFFIMLVES